jgi:hypothetical protein
LQVIWDTSDAGGHAENTDGNEIWRGTAFINPDLSEPNVDYLAAAEEAVQSATGMRDDIVNKLRPEVFKNSEEMTTFGLYLGKMSHWFGPGTYFTNDHQ